MKRLANVSKIMRTSTLPLKYLVVVMASMVAVPISQADVANKKIGDLEIYKAAEGGKITVTMMLDTSGSMDASVTTAACDLPSDVSSQEVDTEDSTTTPKYTRKFCKTGGNNNTKIYFYEYKSNNSKWESCGINGSSDKQDCKGSPINPPSTDGYQIETSGKSKYYYKTGTGSGKFYDRLTRLKDAIFELMDDTDLDSKKVAIGIGQFSSQSDKANTYDGGDGSSGKILVPAALMTSTQRDEIRAAVAKLRGENGTPTANAYAEAGAYMLGNTTSTTITTPREEYVGFNNYRYYQCAAWRGINCVSYFTSDSRSITNTFGYTSAACGAYTSGTCLSRNKIQSAKDWGFSGFDKSVNSSKSGSNYVSPLSSNNATCDGRGIYFLTDGEPNSSPAPLPMMQSALGAKGALFGLPTSGTLPKGSDTVGSGMPEVGAFAKALRSPTLNPLGAQMDILTAVVGFGSVFNVDRVADEAKPNPEDRIIRKLTYTNSKGEEKEGEFYNCAKITALDARNACNWGAKSHPELPNVGTFGEGGFYAAQTTEDVVNSVLSFVKDLDQSLPSTPSGTIIIPNDPYRADSQLAVAYYPTLQPTVASNDVIWKGNMKKYSLNEGTLYGKDNKKLFKNVKGELNETAQDLWSDKDYNNANDKVESGGFYARLNTPATGIASVRTLYVEDWKSTTDQATKLRKVSVNGAGKFTLDGNPLSNTNQFNDTSTYSETTLRKLLNFLGFDNLPSTATAVKDMTLTSTNVTAAVKVVGATLHSTPASVSYSATLDDSGKVTDTRDDYVLFGSTEGGLHLVNADNYSNAGDGGKERFVFIPREILKDPNKSDALIKDQTKTAIGSPNFGIDAPWLVSADYKYDFSNKRVSIDTSDNKGIYAYGGLRMGGEAFYGLNLEDKDAPSILFSITPATSGFSRMGQIWAKPTKAKIKTSSSDTGTDVLIFGGGYDMCYENEGFQVGLVDSILGGCALTTSAKGNAVYIINARTGALIWSASSNSGATKVVSDMKNSIVGGITTLDRDNDGFMDHIYFADLGGQLFRADFTNAGFVKPVTSGTATPESGFSNTRVTRILKSAHTTLLSQKYAYRFYERPVVSFYRNSTTNTLFALVNVISGDRSSPLSKIRNTTAYADRLYGIIDSDVTKANDVFYASNFTTASNINGQKVVDLADSNLVQLPTAIGTGSAAGYSLTQKNNVISTMQSGAQRGWYYSLTRFDGFDNVRYTKGVGKSEVIDNFLYTTVYNPDMSYGSADACSATIVGGSERQLYCLPYGICLDDTSKNGTAGFVRAGQGIQELTLGPRSSTLSNQRLLIGTQTLAERQTGRLSFGSDGSKSSNSLIDDVQGLTSADQILGNGTAPEMIFYERFILQPKTWYEVD
tara:strand:+ start:2876 stop:7000 length:4125 start_codon:yes stop_codon:yes gene_type:complete